MESKKFHKISGKEGNDRLETSAVEESVQKAVAAGHRKIEIEAYGQHGIG